jgi:hypothetical protein
LWLKTKATNEASAIRGYESGLPTHELVDVDPVGAPRSRVVDVCEPLGLEGHRGELLKLRGGQDAPIASPGEPSARHHQLLTLSHVHGLPSDVAGGRRALTSRAPYCLLHPFFAVSHTPFINSTYPHKEASERWPV